MANRKFIIDTIEISDSDWLNACRTVFSNSPNYWELRNKIINHPCKSLVSIPKLFSFFKHNSSVSNDNIEQISINAAVEVLEVLEDIKNRPYFYEQTNSIN